MAGRAPAPAPRRARVSTALTSLVRWFDSWAGAEAVREGDRSIDWLRVVPFLLLHASVGFVLVVGWSPVALAVAAAWYALRMFAITAFYHRYFSHRAFRTSRAVQFLFALLGSSAVQRGPLWWAAHHRRHHRHSDEAPDAHSPEVDGFWWSHVGWLLARENYRTRIEEVRDLARFPELCFLDRFDALVPLASIAAFYALGTALEHLAPGLGTDGPQMLVWGFVVSTVALYHCTFAINSIAHRFGSQPYETRDQSRNNALLALLTLGEGWHNNHHRYPGAARQGFRRRELDLSWYGLRVLAALGLVWDLHPVPARVRAERR
ncbi:MAG TPA: acyl-CoA desaturase [Planctomycetota bacterium]